MAAFRRNDRGLTDLLNDMPARRVIDDASEAARAGAAAAVHSETGRTAKSYQVQPAEAGPRGAHGAMFTDHPAGHIIEWGSEDTTPQAPIRRGARKAGLKLQEKSK